MLWVGDILYGPKVRYENKIVQSYLMTILDDCSRFPVGAAFDLRQDTLAVETVLKKAILTYGIPEKLYLDNAKVFVEKSLLLAAARLGFHVVHSKPGDPSSRGKIERFYRTVRDKFLDNFMLDWINEPPRFDTLQVAFSEWLYDEYMLAEHSVINDTPHNHYLSGLKKVTIRWKTGKEIARAFYQEIIRKVSGDALVSIDNLEYEVPGRFIGKKVTLHRDADLEGDVLFLFEEEGAEPIIVKPVNRAANAEFPIRFHNNDF